MINRLFQEVLQGQFVAFQPETENTAHRFARYMGQFAEILPCMHIGNMHFHHRRFDSRDGVADSHGSMRVPGGVENDAICKAKAKTLYFSDQFAFHVALVIKKGYLRILLSQGFQERFKRLVAVNIGFPFAEQVEIGAVDDGNCLT